MERLGRRGKYLVWELADEVFLLMHLRMTGTLLLDPSDDPPYERVRLVLDGGRHEVRFCDPRRFGTGELALGRPALDAFFEARLGMEPLGDGLSGAALRRLARGRTRARKGVPPGPAPDRGRGQHLRRRGALPRARASAAPGGPAHGRAQWDAVAEGVRGALSAGLAAGGATIDDFRDADGAPGAFQDEFLVHRRAGEPCPVCGGGDREVRGGGPGDLRLRALPAPAAAQAASAVSSRRRPERSAWTSSMKPPITSPSMTTCGKLIMPVSCDSAARPEGSLARLCSSYARPRSWSSCLARVQNEQGSVV